MRYVKAEYEKYIEDLTYRIYLTDSLFYQADGKRLTKRYAEFAYPQIEDTRSGDEIAFDVITRLGLNNG